MIRSRDDRAAREAAAAIKAILSKGKTEGLTLLGPAPCPLERISSNFRHQLLLSGKDISGLLNWVRTAGLHEGTKNNVYLEIDVDPISML